MNLLEKGRSGETRARAYLESKGYRFLEANFRTRLGELDLVMRHRDAVVFVEVKLRQNAAFGSPQGAVTFSKQKKIIKAALEYAKARGLEKSPLRFDVVSIGPQGVEHLENAFGAEGGSYTL